MVMTSLLERGVHFTNRLHDCMQSLKGTTIVPLDVSWRVEHYELYLYIYPGQYEQILSVHLP